MFPLGSAMYIKIVRVKKKYWFSFVPYSVLCVYFSLSVLLFEFSSSYFSNFWCRIYFGQFFLIFSIFPQKKIVSKRKVILSKNNVLPIFYNKFKNNFFIFFSFISWISFIAFVENPICFVSMFNCCGNRIEIVRVFIFFNNFQIFGTKFHISFFSFFSFFN